MARRLPSEPTDAGARLWAYLRAKRLVGARFRRQHPVGPCAVDFDCPASSLAIELDGDQPADAERNALDAERTRYLSAQGVRGAQGVRVIRFANREVLTDLCGVLGFIREALTD